MNVTRLTLAAGALLSIPAAALAAQPSVTAAAVKVPPIVEAVDRAPDTATCGALGAARDLPGPGVIAVNLADPALAAGRGGYAFVPDGRGGYSCLVTRGVHTVDA
jgi:hypothetical protein